MGLISKLKSRIAKQEPTRQPQADSPPDAVIRRGSPPAAGPSPDDPSPVAASPVVASPADLPSNLPPAAPCPSCRSPLFWLDPYQHLHCRGCDPPPSPAMVRKRLVVATAGDAELFGEQHEWEVIPVDQRHRRPGGSACSCAACESRATGGLSANPRADVAETFDIDLGLGAGPQRWTAVGQRAVRVSPPCGIRHDQIDPWAMDGEGSEDHVGS